MIGPFTYILTLEEAVLLKQLIAKKEAVSIEELAQRKVGPKKYQRIRLLLLLLADANLVKRQTTYFTQGGYRFTNVKWQATELAKELWAE
jgi:predicted transcriptional regulator